MSRGIVFSILFLSSLQVHETARVLAWFPTPAISHQVVFRPLTHELAKRRLEVAVVTTQPAFPRGQTPTNLTEINLHDISYSANVRLAKDQNMLDICDQIVYSCKCMINVIDAQLNTTEMKSIINEDKNVDLLLLEGFSIPLVLTNVIDAPVIQFSSYGPTLGQLEAIGAPGQPLIYLSSISKRIYNLSFWEELQELYVMLRVQGSLKTICLSVQNMLQKHFGKNLSSMVEWKKNVDLLFLNEHSLWNDNRPVPPNVVYIGGIHLNSKKDLPKDLKAYLDSSKNGVIYMSFGTNVFTSFLPPEKVQAFIKVFSKLPYDVLWKWDQDELPGRSPNIRISKWLPQSDLLRHPKVKLFITQGGLQSSHEAIDAGVPVIGVPILNDQWYNVQHFVKYKVGIQLDISTLDEANLKNAIETLIGDASYRENMVKLGAVLRDQPTPPLQRAVWWTEHVLRHGGARHLRAPAAHMPWTQYYEIELVLILLGLLTVVIFVGILIVNYSVSFLKMNFESSLPNLKIKTT